MLSSAKYEKEFLLLDADSRRAFEFVTELDRDWDIGPVSINQVGDRIQVLFWSSARKKEGINKAMKTAKQMGVAVRRVTFK